MADDPASCGAQTVHTPCRAFHVRHTGAAVIDTRRTCQETEAWGGAGLLDGPGGGPQRGEPGLRQSCQILELVLSGGTLA